MKKKDFTTACEAFSKSNRADPSPGTQINLALCFENQKKWASAWTWYRSAAGLAEQRNQAARQKTAEESANRIRPQIHYVVIAVKDPPGDMVVKRDGAEVIITLSGKDVPLPIDPGDHTIDITSAAKKPFTKTITMPDNANTDRVDVALEDAPLDQVTPGTPTKTVVINRTVETTNDGDTQRLVGVILGAAGIADGIGAIAFYAVAKGQANDRDNLRNSAGSVPRAQLDATNAAIASKNTAANRDQAIAIVMGATALGLIAAGVVIYLVAPKPRTIEKTGYLMPTPLVGPGFGGFGLTGTF